MDTLDLRGMRCPIPLLKTKKRLMGMQAGEGLRVRVDDPAAPDDLKLFCEKTGHVFVCDDETEDGSRLIELRSKNG